MVLLFCFVYVASTVILVITIIIIMFWYGPQVWYVIWCIYLIGYLVLDMHDKISLILLL